MEYNYAKLNGAVVEMFRTRKNFAKAMGLSEHTMSQKLNGKSEWKQEEIAKACEMLRIDPVDLAQYFFTINVQ